MAKLRHNIVSVDIAKDILSLTQISIVMTDTN